MSKVFPAGAVLAIAMIAHAANAAWCGHLGDTSQVPWDDAPEWQRSSVIHGVEFHLGNPDAGDQASHEEWMKVKLADGWTYGEQKDEQAKTHPCLVEFEKLPVEQQFKDRLFRTLVHASFAAIGPSFVLAETLQADLARVREKLDADKGTIEQLTSSNAALQAEVNKLKSAQAAAPAAVKRKPRSPSARKCGPMGGVDRSTLGELLLSGVHEIVFSNGKNEIAGLEPVEVGPDAWVKHASGWLLTPNVTVDGPQKGARPFEIAGFGLFDGTGKQLAYSRLHEPLIVAPGAVNEIRRSIIF